MEGYCSPHYGVRQYMKEDNGSEKKKLAEVEMERRKYLTMGLSGLVNMGNTCYFNSVIQQLSNCPFIYAILSDSSIIEKLVKKKLYDNIYALEEQNREKGKLLTKESKIKIDRVKFKEEIEQTLTFQLHKVIKTMWDTNGLVKPKSLKETISKHPTLAGYGQQDAQEALQFILDHIHSETFCFVEDIEFKEDVVREVLPNIEKIKNCSKIIEESKNLEEKKKASDALMDMYHENPNTYLTMIAVVQWKSFLLREGDSDFTHLVWGVTCTMRTCKQCGFMSPKFEMFNMIQLAIPKNKSKLTIKDCFDYHFLKQNIDCKCTRCEHKTAEEESFVYIYPTVLFIQFKRFEHEYDKRLFKMVSSKVTELINFPLKGLEFKENSIATNGKDEEISYNLKGVVEHRGSLDSGHYVSYCENPVSGEWFEFNDDDVLRIPKDELEKELVTRNAYLLMYQKSNTIFDEDSDEEEFITPT